MRVKDLKGREHVLTLKNKPRENCSSLHEKAREILKESYPLYLIYEEVPVPGEHMFLDFFIPNLFLVVEVHGQQHYEENNFFHKDTSHFLKSKKRDSRKKTWCDTNNFILIELPYNKEKEWKTMIQKI